MDADLLRTIKQWQSRLTGLPEASFEGLTLQEKIDLAAQWYSSHVIAEQMAVLTMARIVIEDEVEVKHLRQLFGSREVREKPIGRFNYVAGISEWALKAWNVFLPLLKGGGYRPYIRQDIGKPLLALCEELSASGQVTPANIAATIYRRPLAPAAAKRTINTLRAFAKVDPEGAKVMLDGLMQAREAALETIAAVPEVEQRIADMETDE